MAWKKRAQEQVILIEQQRDDIAMLQADVADLRSQLAKNSSNFSKPPSSDIVKPPQPKDKERRKRKIGAQQGHKQNLRQPIAPELVDEIVQLELTHCSACGRKLDLATREPKTSQQLEVVAKPVIVTEYQQLMYWCKHCQCHHYARLPEAVEKAGRA